MRRPYTLLIPSQYPLNSTDVWSLVFSTANERYDSEAETVSGDLTSSECQSGSQLQVVFILGWMCYSAVLSSRSLFVYSRSLVI